MKTYKHSIIIGGGSGVKIYEFIHKSHNVIVLLCHFFSREI
jgi:hypothetical protein